MKRVFSVAAFAAACLAPGAAQSQTMSGSMVGAGPHGYDWLIGKWSCVNDSPSPTNGPANTTLQVARSNAGSALSVRVTGNGFDGSGYIVYAASTKRWTNPSIYPDGTFANEATTNTGAKTVWTGPLVNGATGKTTQSRDTYTFVSPTKFVDVGATMSGGVWKKQYTSTCTKT